MKSLSLRTLGGASVSSLICSLTWNAALAVPLTPAKPAAPLDAPVSSVRTSASSTSSSRQFHVSGGVGIGSFQDIQVPADQTTGSHADGRVTAEENSNHLGFPMFVGLGLSAHGSAWRTIASFDALQMRATSGPPETQSSSYSRLNLASSAEYLAHFGRYTLAIGAGVGGRRSSFNNISNSHYIDALLARGLVSLETSAWKIFASGAVAPQARFYYSPRIPLVGGEAFRSSKTSLYEISAGTSFALSSNVSLDLSLAQEQAHVLIENISDYQAFGLQVSDTTTRPKRDYQLNTTLARIGFTKSL